MKRKQSTEQLIQINFCTQYVIAYARWKIYAQKALQNPSQNLNQQACVDSVWDTITIVMYNRWGNWVLL